MSQRTTLKYKTLAASLTETNNSKLGIGVIIEEIYSYIRLLSNKCDNYAYTYNQDQHIVLNWPV